MIRFPCPCGNRLEVPDDEAGGLVQCPACRRLNDVPAASDAPSIEDDGTFRLSGEEEHQRAALDMDEAEVFYSAELRRKRGNELDLRHDVETFLTIGDAPPDAPAERRVRARYDPETGELIRPMDLAPMQAIPVDAAAGHPARGPTRSPARAPAADMALPLGYAKRSTPAVEPIPSLLSLPMRLLLPHNLFVWGIVAAILLVSATVMGVPLAGALYTLILFPPLMMLAIGHVALVIESTGPMEADDLPAPLRDVSFVSDIWVPFFRTVQALAITFGLVILLEVYVGPFPAAVSWLLYLLAAAAFPAALLTFVAGGLYANLAPHRLLAVMRLGGLSYVLAVVLLLVGMQLVGFGFVGVLSVAVSWASQGVFIRVPNFEISLPGVGVLGWGPLYIVAAGSLVAGVYLMHLFCWIMGVLFRRHHEQFPWIMQRHLSTRRDTMRQLEDRYRQQHAPAPPEMPRSRST
ncbi:MAG: hypothetical protein ACFCVE_00320 [Phycisphaerae bacterium]